jgi:thiosulfate/3-mercaptopyruvate sulfurtransferase
MFKTLISTDVLAAQRDDSWTIVDCRYDLHDAPWGALQYRKGHIPGAVYASLSHDLAAPPTGTNGRHPLPCVEDIAATFGRLGISNETQVVAYDQDSGMFASRLWWMLRYLGHDAVAVLDGAGPSGRVKAARHGAAKSTGRLRSSRRVAERNCGSLPIR